jgi:hypothetical protein
VEWIKEKNFLPARSFVQYEDGAGPKHGASETEQLFLPYGEVQGVHVGV